MTLGVQCKSYAAMGTVRPRMVTWAPALPPLQFLPPLLLDSALSIDYFLFKKVGADRCNSAWMLKWARTGRLIVEG